MDDERRNRHILSREEIEQMEKATEEERQQRLAPYKALRRKMDAGLRHAMANNAVSDEELLTMSAATTAWKPGLKLAVGDTVMHGDAMFVTIQAHRTQAGWEPGTATQALYRRVKTEGSTEWQPDTDYATGEEAAYDGQTYICQQAHTSQVGWEPPNVPAIWAAKTE